MKKEAALAILEALAEGFDPYTNERLPQESPYFHPSTKRALTMAIAALEATGVASQKELAEDRWAIAPSKRRVRPMQAGKPWSPEEDAILMQGYIAGQSPKALAEQHGRSVGSITSRLAVLGLRSIPYRKAKGVSTSRNEE